MCGCVRGEGSVWVCEGEGSVWSVEDECIAHGTPYLLLRSQLQYKNVSCNLLQSSPLTPSPSPQAPLHSPLVV